MSADDPREAEANPEIEAQQSGVFAQKDDVDPGIAAVDPAKLTAYMAGVQGERGGRAYGGRGPGGRIEEESLSPPVQDTISVLRSMVEENPERAPFMKRMIYAVDKVADELNQETMMEVLSADSSIEALINAILVANVVEESPLKQAMLRGQKRRQELIEKCDGFVGSTEAGELAGGITRQSINDKRRAGKLLGFKIGGGRGYKYPVFQFHNGEVLHGLEETLDSMAIEDSWMRLEWLLMPKESLGDRTPVEALREGDVDEVVQAARRWGHQGT